MRTLFVLCALCFVGMGAIAQTTQTFVQAQTTFYVTADHSNLEAYSNPLTMPAGSIRYTLVSINAAGEPTSFTNCTVRMIVKDNTDSNSVGNVVGVPVTESIEGNRVVFAMGSLFAKEYLIEAFRIKNDEPTNVLKVASHILTVTNMPSGVTVSVGATTVNSTNIFNYTISNIFQLVTQILTSGVASVQGETGSVVFAAQTTSNMLGYLAWDGLTLLVGTNTADVDDAVTLQGYTPQQVADLTRSTADYGFYDITPAPTVTILRANGPFQKLEMVQNTWVAVPAGLTNYGYTILLEVKGSTNALEFLPDNVLISTNIVAYTNKTRTYVIHHSPYETSASVRGLDKGPQ